MNYTKTKEANYSTSEEVYFTRGKAGVTIDVTDSRKYAIQHYLQAKERGAEVSLVLRRGGILYPVHPTGSLADFS